MELMQQISLNLQAGDDKNVARLTQQALDDGLTPQSVLDNGLLAGMAVISSKFKAHEIFLPDVLLAARAMYSGLNILKPLLAKTETSSKGRVVLGTVQGDLHDIGKNLVGIMLKGAGFDVIDLGNDVSPEKFVDAAIAEKAPVIGLSALLTTTMPVMKKVVALVKERGHSGRIRVIIGGAPVTEQYAREIGADAYGFDGVNAVESVTRLMSGA